MRHKISGRAVSKKQRENVTKGLIERREREKCALPNLVQMFFCPDRLALTDFKKAKTTGTSNPFFIRVLNFKA